MRRDGQIRETELLMARHHATPRHVTARVAPLSSTLVLALVEDRTRERRVEAVRRDFVANVSATSSRPPSAPSGCSPRPSATRPTTRRPSAGSPAGC